MSKRKFKEELNEKIFNIKDEKEIPKIADEILKTYGYTNCVVDISELAWKLGFYVGNQKIKEKAYIASGKELFDYFAKLDIFKGCRKWKIIVVNSSSSNCEARYDIAVCMAYYLLNANSKYTEIYKMYRKNNECEFVMAKKLAEHILVPNKLLVNQIKQVGLDKYKLSECFKLPEHIMQNIIINRMENI